MVDSLTEATSLVLGRHTPEIDLLLCCARLHPSASVCTYIQNLVQTPIDWPSFFQIASQQGVSPIVYWNLKQLCANDLPPGILKQIRYSLQQHTQHNLVLTQELCRLLSCLAAADLAVLPFKGPVLAIAVYDNISLRQISDLDLLVHDKEINKVKDLLIDDGYQLKLEVPWETHLVRENSIHNIDLHNLIAPQHLSHPLTNQDIWQHTQPMSLAGQTITSLTPEMNLIMLCLHGTKECWRHLNRICDVAALVQGATLDWEQLIALARRWGYQRLVGLGLTLAQTLLGADLPKIATQWMAQDAVSLQKLASKVEQRLFLSPEQSVGEVERSLFHMRTRERWPHKLKTFVGLINHSGWMTPTEADRKFWDLPDSLSFMYYLVRPIRVLQKYQKQL